MKQVKQNKNKIKVRSNRFAEIPDISRGNKLKLVVERREATLILKYIYRE